MKTDQDFNKNDNINNESILNHLTKHDNTLQRLFNMINNYNKKFNYK